MIDNIYELDEEVEEINNAIEDMFDKDKPIPGNKVLKLLDLKKALVAYLNPEK